MDKSLALEFEALAEHVRATPISDAGKHAADWCLKKLPALYGKYAESNESRFGDEITALLKAVIKELTKETPHCPKAHLLTVRLVTRIETLHEELGLPRLGNIMPAAPAVRPAKKKAAARAKKTLSK